MEGAKLIVPNKPYAVVFDKTLLPGIIRYQDKFHYMGIMEIIGIYVSPTKAYVFTPTTAVEEQIENALLALGLVSLRSDKCISNPPIICNILRNSKNTDTVAAYMEAGREIEAAKVLVSSVSIAINGVSRLPTHMRLRNLIKTTPFIETEIGIQFIYSTTVNKTEYILNTPNGTVRINKLTIPYSKLREAVSPQDIDPWRHPYAFFKVFGGDALVRALGLSTKYEVVEAKPNAVTLMSEDGRTILVTQSTMRITDRDTSIVVSGEARRMFLNTLLNIRGVGKVDKNGGVITTPNGNKIFLTSPKNTVRVMR